MRNHNIDSLIPRRAMSDTSRDTRILFSNNILDIVSIDNSSPCITTSYYYNRIKYSLAHYIVWMLKNQLIDHIIVLFLCLYIGQRGGEIQYENKSKCFK